MSYVLTHKHSAKIGFRYGTDYTRNDDKLLEASITDGLGFLLDKMMLETDYRYTVIRRE